jgi:hypothetical protein
MIDFTRKKYFELWRDNQPVIAGGRQSNRHTSLIEAGEHASDHATEIQSGGTYEVRVGAEVFYEVKINYVYFDHTVEPPPQAAQGEVALGAASYTVNEDEIISISILRTEKTDQRVRVDWSITNANAIPATGSATFELGDTVKNIPITGGSVGPTEVGQLAITGVVGLTEPGNPPAIVSPSTAVFTINETPTIATIPDLNLNIGETQDMSVYINDGGNRRTSTAMNGLAGFASYDSGTEVLTAVSEGTETGLTLELTY